MRSFFRGLISLVKWLIITLLLVEVGSFLIITLSNYWIYGQVPRW